jgi:hypothetical protein
MVGMKLFAFVHASLLERGQVRNSVLTWEPYLGLHTICERVPGEGMEAVYQNMDLADCAAKAKEDGRGFMFHDATGMKCVTSPTCDSPQTGTGAPWQIYKVSEVLQVVNDGPWFAKTFEKLDNVSAEMDGLERTQFQETLAVSTLEADLGAAGIKIGDFEQEAVPFEKSVFVLRQNLSVWRNSSVDAEHEFNASEAEISSLENQSSAIMKSPEEMAAARAANSALEESRSRLAPDAEPLLARAHADASAFDAFEELALNKTEEAAGAMNVRGAIDRAREAMRVVAEKSYTKGIPQEMRPDKLIAQFE